MSVQVNRRTFLKSGAATAGGLLIGFYLPERNELAAASTDAKLNAYVHVGSDDIVTLMIHKAEMGQGTVTSLSMLLAEELECDWKKIRTEFPGVSPEYGPYQGVVGSHEHPDFVAVAQGGGRNGARNARRSGGAALGCRQVAMPRGVERS